MDTLFGDIAAYPEIEQVHVGTPDGCYVNVATDGSTAQIIAVGASLKNTVEQISAALDRYTCSCWKFVKAEPMTLLIEAGGHRTLFEMIDLNRRGFVDLRFEKIT